MKQRQRFWSFYLWNRPFEKGEIVWRRADMAPALSPIRVTLSFDNKVIEWKRADMAPALSPIRVTLSFNWVKECEPFSSLHIPRYWLKKRYKTLTPIIVIWSFLTFIHHGVKHVKPAQSPIQGPDFVFRVADINWSVASLLFIGQQLISTRDQRKGIWTEPVPSGWQNPGSERM